MNVCFLTYARHKPSTRYRVMQYLPFLRRSGMQIEVRELPKGRLARYRTLWCLPRYDVIVLQKRLLSSFMLRLLRGKCSRLVYDFDDAVMFSQNAGDGQEPRGRRLKRFANTVRTADLVIAGNSYLSEKASTYSSKVKVIPSMPELPGETYPVHAAANSIVVGWMGSGSNVDYLKRLIPVFDELAQEFPCFRFRMISDKILEEARGKAWFEFARWSMESEWEELGAFDIGIMPLDDNVWTRGKCGFKILQYFASSRPVVSSPVGVNADFVWHGVNGYLASSTDEWRDALADLISNPDLRISMGIQAKERFDRDFNLSTWAAELEKCLRG